MPEEMGETRFPFSLSRISRKDIAGSPAQGVPEVAAEKMASFSFVEGISRRRGVIAGISFVAALGIWRSAMEEQTEHQG